MICVTCTIKATSYNESFVTSGHPHESTEKYEVISIIVNNNNWKDAVEAYFSKKKTPDVIQYPLILAIHLSEPLDVELGMEITINPVSKSILKDMRSLILTYKAELIISRENENYWLNCVENDGFFRYASIEPIQFDSPICQQAYMVFFKQT